jgi:hypothetical protein
MNNENSDEEIKDSCELQDIQEMIMRYVTANKNKVAFVCSFIGFKDGHCHDCHEDCDDIVNIEASKLMAYGDLDTVRTLLEDMRNVIEDHTDKEERFVNL